MTSCVCVHIVVYTHANYEHTYIYSCAFAPENETGSSLSNEGIPANLLAHTERSAPFVWVRRIESEQVRACLYVIALRRKRNLAK